MYISKFLLASEKIEPLWGWIQSKSYIVHDKNGHESGRLFIKSWDKLRTKTYSLLSLKSIVIYLLIGAIELSCRELTQAGY